MKIKFEHLVFAKYEYITRLAKWLGVENVENVKQNVLVSQILTKIYLNGDKS